MQDVFVLLIPRYRSAQHTCLVGCLGGERKQKQKHSSNLFLALGVCVSVCVCDSDDAVRMNEPTKIYRVCESHLRFHCRRRHHHHRHCDVWFHSYIMYIHIIFIAYISWFGLCRRDGIAEAFLIGK